MQNEYFGSSSLLQLQEIIKNEKPKCIFLVTGKNSFNKSPLKKELLDQLAGVKVIHHYDFDNNPRLEDIEEGIKIYKQNKIDLTIAFGGGSVIDTAKAINCLAAQEDLARKYVTGELEPGSRSKPLIAIPTTCGTGSEATHFAVVYINKIKYSFAHSSVLPSYVILDPRTLDNLPSDILANTAADALSQAVEAYWSVNSNQDAKNYAREAIELILPNLELAVNPINSENRWQIMVAANLAGKAIDISKTTACHAISYPMTSYFNVPHGQACIYTLGEMFKFNVNIDQSTCQDKRGVEYVKKTMLELLEIFQVKTEIEALDKIEVLCLQVGLKTKLGQLGITFHDLPLIVKNGFNPQRVKNNPRLLTADNVQQLLEKIL